MTVNIETTDSGSTPTVETTVSTTQLADALETAQVEAAHTLQQEADVEQAQATAEAAIDTAIEALVHSHPELEHDHSDMYERLSSLETWRTDVETAATAATTEVVEVEAVTQADAPAAETTRETPKRFGFRRGK